MAHPIAGENQYPFVVGGLLVDSAKIDGVVYTKELYIYKQSSSFMFDLIHGTTGKIFKNITVTWYNDRALRLDYNDSPSYISNQLPERTFAKKIQDPSRGIYGFLVMYQLNKIKVSTGDYIYSNAADEESNADPVLQNYIMFEKNLDTTTNMYSSGGWYYPGSIVEFRLVPTKTTILPPKMSYTIQSKDVDITQWVSEIQNDDPLLYKFKINDEIPLPPYDNDSSPYRWNVDVKFFGEGQTFEFSIYVSHFVSVNSSLYINGQQNLKIGYDTTYVLSRGEPQYGPAWVIENTDIATVNSDGVVTPISEGSTFIRCYHANSDGTPNMNSAYNESTINVYADIPICVKYYPNDKFTYEVGEEVQYTYTTYPEGSKLIGDNTWGAVISNVANLSESGKLTVTSASEYNGNIVYSNAIFTALKPNRLVASNNTYDSSFSITTVKPGTIVKPISYSVSNLINGEYCIIPIQDAPSSISVSMIPYWTTGSKLTNVVVEDTSILDVQYDEYYMNAAPSFTISMKGRKPGKTNITFSPKEMPELVITKTIYVV